MHANTKHDIPGYMRSLHPVPQALAGNPPITPRESQFPIHPAVTEYQQNLTSAVNKSGPQAIAGNQLITARESRVNIPPAVTEYQQNLRSAVSNPVPQAQIQSAIPPVVTEHQPNVKGAEHLPTPPAVSSYQPFFFFFFFRREGPKTEGTGAKPLIFPPPWGLYSFCCPAPQH